MATPIEPLPPVEHDPTVVTPIVPPPVAPAAPVAVTPVPNPLITSLIRTVVPIIVGAALAWAVRQGIPATDALRGPLTEILTAVFSAAYYTGARLLEHYVTPKAGLLLGVKTPPLYPPKLPVSVGRGTVEWVPHK
jgi:hypothetical protein